MIAHDNFHSLLVGWAKILLPLCALALLSTLFLFARSPADQSDIPFADIAEIARDQRISAPQFSGVADDGSQITISARTAKPKPDQVDVLEIIEPNVSVDAPDGSTMQITAGIGDIDGTARIARLTGLARLTTSTGYIMETSGMLADFGAGIVTSTGALEVQTPFGDLTAGQVQITLPQDDAGGHQLLFTQGVKLVYKPED